MNTLVIDASIAIKWVVEEDGTSAALVLRQKAKLIAPNLLVAECANIFWKKVQRGELLKAEALFAARLLQGAEIELLPTRSLFESATSRSSHLSRANRRPVINQSDCTSIPKGVLVQRRISRSSAVTSREALRSANAR